MAKGCAIRVSLCKCICEHVYLILKCRIRGQPMQSPNICKYESMEEVASRSRWNNRNGKSLDFFFFVSQMFDATKR